MRFGRIEPLVEQLTHRGREPIEPTGVYLGHRRRQRLACTLFGPDECLVARLGLPMTGSLPVRSEVPNGPPIVRASFPACFGPLSMASAICSGEAKSGRVHSPRNAHFWALWSICGATLWAKLRKVPLTWWALRDSNPRPQPCESVLGAFADLGLPTKSQVRRQMTSPVVSTETRCFPLDRARSAHAGLRLTAGA
jgi:hypothetical protein